MYPVPRGQLGLGIHGAEELIVAVASGDLKPAALKARAPIPGLIPGKIQPETILILDRLFAQNLLTLPLIRCSPHLAQARLHHHLLPQAQARLHHQVQVPRPVLLRVHPLAHHHHLPRRSGEWPVR